MMHGRGIEGGEILAGWGVGGAMGFAPNRTSELYQPSPETYRLLGCPLMAKAGSKYATLSLIHDILT